MLLSVEPRMNFKSTFRAMHGLRQPLWSSSIVASPLATLSHSDTNSREGEGASLPVLCRLCFDSLQQQPRQGARGRTDRSRNRASAVDPISNLRCDAHSRVVHGDRFPDLRGRCKRRRYIRRASVRRRLGICADRGLRRPETLRSVTSCPRVLTVAIFVDPLLPVGAVIVGYRGRSRGAPLACGSDKEERENPAPHRSGLTLPREKGCLRCSNSACPTLMRLTEGTSQMVRT